MQRDDKRYACLKISLYIYRDIGSVMIECWLRVSSVYYMPDERLVFTLVYMSDGCLEVF